MILELKTIKTLKRYTEHREFKEGKIEGDSELAAAFCTWTYALIQLAVWVCYVQGVVTVLNKWRLISCHQSKKSYPNNGEISVCLSVRLVVCANSTVKCRQLEKQKDPTGQVLFDCQIFNPNAAKDRQRHTSIAIVRGVRVLSIF